MNSVLVPGDQEKEIRSRSGYLPRELLKAFQTAMNESGVMATGRALHFSADLVCSGGYDVWVRAIWEFAIEHIGIGSPRIFVYLKKRIGELDGLISRLDEETLYKDEEFQTRVAEIIFVIRECPRRSRTAWPKVGPETHRDGWLKAVSTNATETEVVRRVFKSGSDMFPLHAASCELLKAISDGATERCMFWVRWVLDEDHRLRKENKGSGLSTLDRGPPSLRGKNKSEACYYIQQLFAEAYKDYAGKQMIRMSEEFQALIDLFRGSDPRISAKGRKDILALMAQILCEVPRWKVPAAPALIKDPVTLSRTISQSGNFFKEVLVEPRVSLTGKKSVFKGKDSAKLRESLKKATTMEDQMEAYEAAMNAYLNKQ
jgi:hypothetical protein